MANQGFVTGNLQMFAPHNHEAPVLTQYGAEVKFTEAGFCNKHNDVQLRQKKKIWRMVRHQVGVLSLCCGMERIVQSTQ